MRGQRRVGLVVALVGALVAMVWSAAGTGRAAGSGQARWAITDLGVHGVDYRESSAVAIAAHGQIAGSNSKGDAHAHAFLWRDGRMTDLGTIGGTFSQAVAINDSGQVAGNSTWSLTGMHAFLWQKGKMTDLGVLGAGDDNHSEASAINNRGQIVGSSSTGVGFHAFLWQDGKMTDLGTLGRPGGIEVWPKASAINERGQVVGTSSTRNRSPAAYLWQTGRMRNLGTLGGATWAYAINDLGQIVGGSNIAPRARGWGSEHAFMWKSGKMTDLGTLGGKRSGATAINNHGQIVGWSQVASGAEHAFLWQKGKMIDLGTLGATSSDAVAINERGQVIVNRSARSCQHEQGFEESEVTWSDSCFGTASVWDSGTLTNLGTIPGGKNSSATALNERGQIVGWSTLKTGERHAVLWTLKTHS